VAAEEPESPDWLPWLRRVVSERRATAQALDDRLDGQWYSAQELFHGLSPRDEAKHIAAQTPRAVIDRCDAELALIGLLEEADRRRYNPGPACPAHLATRHLAIGEAVGIIARGYRGSPGWDDRWES
jgi:hypothetical protein